MVYNKSVRKLLDEFSQVPLKKIQIRTSKFRLTYKREKEVVKIIKGIIKTESNLVKLELLLLSLKRVNNAVQMSHCQVSLMASCPTQEIEEGCEN